MMAIYRDERLRRVDGMEETIVYALGERGALDAITRALSYDQKEEIYRYIIRVYDLDTEEKEADTHGQTYTG